MFTARQSQWEWELVKWTVLVLIALSLAMVVARLAGAGELNRPPEPARVPSIMVDDARPLTALPTEQPNVGDANIRLWIILDLQRSGEAEGALTLWNDLPLPCDTEVWKRIAMAMAHLQLGETDRAAEALDFAEQLEPMNPVLHYYWAILRLQQARDAREWYDAVGPAVFRLAAYRPRDIAPNTRSMYELAAMMEFEAAIENAPHLDNSVVLSPPDVGFSAVVPPVTVGDLLTALGADKFEGRSHNMLGVMFLDRQQLARAEEHMDAAVTSGEAVVFGYRDLGEAYERAGQHGLAARAYLKSIPHETGKALPLQKAAENFWKALRGE